MALQFYIDESGQTGDLSTVKLNTYFTEQKIFSLAAFGVEQDAMFLDRARELIARHRIQGLELKSYKTYNKPDFLLNLISLIEEFHAPIFVELVDKHFFLVAHLVQWMLCRPLGDMEFDIQMVPLNGAIANYMAVYFPPELSQRYAACCQSLDHGEIRSLFVDIIEVARHSRVQPDIAAVIVKITGEALREFDSLPPADAIDNALPLPDRGRHGKLMWVVPNITSLTNIYARINKFVGKDVGAVTICHDEQIQLADALLANTAALEQLAAQGISVPINTADYAFSDRATFNFVSSKQSFGIQIADTLAGFAARYVEEKVWGIGDIDPRKAEAFDRLVGMCDRQRGIGMNFIVPDGMVRLLGVEGRPNF